MVLSHLRGSRPADCPGAARCWIGRGPGGSRIGVGCVGWGTRRAWIRGRALADRFTPRRIVAWGVAGALSEELQAGDLALCRRVVDGATGEAVEQRGCADGTTIPFDAPRRCWLRQASSLTWPRPVLRRSTRRALGERFGCELVEMENAALARLARDADAEFLGLRTILDDFAFPPWPSAPYLRFLSNSLRAGARAAVYAAVG